MKITHNKDSILPFVIGFATLMVAFSIAYYFVIFLPSKEEAKQEQARRELDIKQAEQEVKKKELQVYEDCDTEAKTSAQQLLKSKIEIAEKSGLTGAVEYQAWKEASKKGLFLKDDYNEYYDSCLRRHGKKY